MKIVVPIGNTRAAQSLFDVLMGMQWYEGTEILLVTVAPRWVPGTETHMSIPASISETESLAVELRNALPACQVSFFIREGDPKIEIVSFARAAQADLIISATASYDGREPQANDDIAQSIISHAHCPVLLAKPNYDTVYDAQSGFNTVLIPVDDSIYADVAIQWMLKFRWGPHTRFVLSSVIEHENVADIAADNLMRRARLLSAAFGTSKISTEVRKGNPTDEIISIARKYEADLIVIGSHGRVGIQKLIFGSVSESLARRGPCSIAIVRGIAKADDSWHRTGVFRRPRVERITDRYNRMPHRSYSSNDSSPHVIPSGMR